MTRRFARPSNMYPEPSPENRLLDLGAVQPGTADFARLYAVHTGRVRRVIERELGAVHYGAVDTDDVHQEVFIRAWRYLRRGGLGRAPEPGALSGLLHGIAVRRVRDVHRDERRFKRDHGRRVSLSIDPLLPSREADPGDVLWCAELRSWIGHERAALRAVERQILDLRELQGLDYVTIGVLLGCSTANARLRYFRARRRLAQRLDGLWAALVA